MSTSTKGLLKVDEHALNELETHCQRLSLSIHNVMNEITKKLNQISAISVGNIQTCGHTVADMNKQVEDAVHSMYSLIASCEELNEVMLPVGVLAAKIEQIKDRISALEEAVK